MLNTLSLMVRYEHSKNLVKCRVALEYMLERKDDARRDLAT